jgi:hypothetical protein
LVSRRTVSFVGFGTANKPGPALSMARSDAQAQAIAADFSLADCQQTGQSVHRSSDGTYDAEVTLTCTR